MKNAILLACALFLLIPATPSMAAVIHVPDDQPTIQDGINAAVNGDTVLVADGLYTGNGNRDIEFFGKSITVRSENGPQDCTIDCQGSPLENHRGFFFHEGESREALLEGFTVTNGYLDVFGQYGGAVMCSGSASPTIRGNVITGNTSEYGGGIACFSIVNPLIIENRVENNQADYGGGIYGAPSSVLEIVANVVTGNSASTAGGGIQCRGDYAVVTGNTITGNTSEGTVGGLVVSSNYAVVTDNLVSGNSSVTWVGGMTTTGREVLAANNVVLDNQTDGDVGGMAFGSDMIGDGGLMINNLVAGNIAAGDCGGLQFQHSESTVICNTITGNISGQNTGGILILDGYFSDSVITFADNVIWGNNAPGGYEIRMEYNVSHYNPPILQIGHSTLEGGLAAIDACPQCVVVWGDGMLESDPVFVTGSQGSYYLSQIHAGQPVDSPCVDAGNDAASNIGYQTPDGPVSLGELTTRTDGVNDSGQVDMGFHYVWSSAAASLTCVPESGTLPFQTVITAGMANRYAGFTRTMAARINVQLAGGQTYGNWRAGYTNLGPEADLISSWAQTIPALGSLTGLNIFTLVVEDVTAAPYNQPPYPPSGDSATDSCQVTGIAP